MTPLRTGIVVVALGIALAGLLASDAVTTGAGERASTAGEPARATAWSEVKWPFALDQWGTGRAFRCRAPDCGADIELYLRAKLGFCNCTTGVADDEDLDRMGDLVLVGEASPLGTGRPVSICLLYTSPSPRDS